MNPLEVLRRIAEVEFSAIVTQTDLLGAKARILLADGSYVDVWASRKLPGRFGMHWERKHLDGCIYRYDNFPDTDWAAVSTYPFHFHDGAQHNVIAAPFTLTLEQGFRDFMTFVQKAIARAETSMRDA